MKEYLRRGLLSSSAYHIVTGAGLVLFSVIGKPSPIASWRYLLFIVVLALELYLLLAPPSHPVEPSPFVDHIHENGTILDHLFPHRVVYQHVRLLHQVFLFVSVALSRVAPVLFPSLVHSNAAVDQQMVKVVADRLGMLAQSTERELWTMQNVALQSIHHGSLGDETSLDVSKLDEDVMQALFVGMEDVLIEAKLKSEVGPMRSVWDRAVQKRDMFSYGDRFGGKSGPEGPSIKERGIRARSLSF